MGFTDQIDISGFRDPASSFTGGLGRGVQLGLQAIKTRTAVKQQREENTVKGMEFAAKRLTEAKSDDPEVQAALETQISQGAFELGWDPGIKDPITGKMGPRTFTADDIKAAGDTYKETLKSYKDLLTDNENGIFKTNAEFGTRLSELQVKSADFSKKKQAILKTVDNTVREARAAQVKQRQRTVPHEDRFSEENVLDFMMDAHPQADREVLRKFIKDNPGKHGQWLNKHLGVFGATDANKFRAADVVNKNLDNPAIRVGSPEEAEGLARVESIQSSALRGGARAPGLKEFLSPTGGPIQPNLPNPALPAGPVQPLGGQKKAPLTVDDAVKSIFGD